MRNERMKNESKKSGDEVLTTKTKSQLARGDNLRPNEGGLISLGAIKEREGEIFCPFP